MKSQYTTGAQVVMGCKKCRFCGEIIPSLRACKCAVIITVKGDIATVEAALDAIRQTLQVIEEDDEYKGGVKTAEVSITIAVKAPAYQFGPFSVTA